jgi:peptide methionine sulfoxide reductase MsrB
MKRSEAINELVTALAIAQGKIGGATKDSTNPYYSSRYADLASVWGVAREPLSDNKLAVIQTVDCSAPVALKVAMKNEDGSYVDVMIEVPVVTVTTLLAHASGQWVSFDLPMWPAQNTPQAIGTCISYARRYSLAAMVGIYQEDDDGNKASGLEKLQRDATALTARSAAAIPEFSQPLVPQGLEEVIAAIAKEDAKALRQAWNDAMGLGQADFVWKLLNTKQKKTARELLNLTAPKEGDAGQVPKAVQD